jgi:small subunit ribosomal protein S11
MAKATATQQPVIAKAAAKKRVVRVDSYGDAHITASFNNIIISFNKQKRPGYFMEQCRQNGF